MEVLEEQIKQVEVELELRPMEEMQPLQLLVQEEVHWVVMVAMEKVGDSAGEAPATTSHLSSAAALVAAVVNDNPPI